MPGGDEGAGTGEGICELSFGRECEQRAGYARGNISCKQK